MRALRTLAAALGLALPALAGAQAFDLESVAAGFYPSLTLTSGAQTLTITNALGLMQVQSAAPAGMGDRAVVGGNDPFPPLRFSFLLPVVSATFRVGDFGADEDTPITVDAYDAFDVLLGSFSTAWPNGADGSTTILASGWAGGAAYFVGNGAGPSPNSLYWEIEASTPAAVVPEPATVALLATGLLAVGAVARGRRAA